MKFPEKFREISRQMPGRILVAFAGIILLEVFRSSLQREGGISKKKLGKTFLELWEEFMKDFGRNF